MSCQTELKSIHDHLSFSQVSQYLSCPLQHWFRRRFKPDFIAASLQFGKGFHAMASERNQAALENRNVSECFLLKHFYSAWRCDNEIKFNKNESAESLRKIAEAMSKFILTLPVGRIIATEETFMCKIATGLLPVSGAFDVLEIVNQRLFLADYKTCQKKPSPSTVDEDQLVLYRLAADKMKILKAFGLPVVLEYRYITKSENPELFPVRVQYSQSKARRLIAKFRAVDNAIKNDVVFPVKSWKCRNCGYKRLCSKWPELP